MVRAAALEHVLLSAYLFTAYSIKQDLSEGGFSQGQLGQQELGVAQSWSGQIIGVAVQEMLHLALACNMVSAIGFDPEFRREELNFPLSPENMQDYFGYGGQAYLCLWPFSKETIERYAWFEDYDHASDSFPGTPWSDGAASVSYTREGPKLLKGLEEMNISSLVDLYKAIAQGFANLSASGDLFSGDPGKQVTDLEVTGLFNYPPAIGQDENDLIPVLTPVVDLRSALIAINTIIIQGEGPEEDWINFMSVLCIDHGIDYDSFPKIQSPPHHVTFEKILAGIAKYPNWANFVRNVAENPLDRSPCNNDPVCESHVNIIQPDFTREVASLSNALYGTMIDLLIAGFAVDSDTTPVEPDQSDEDYYKVQTYGKTSLIQISIRSMSYLISPLSNALTQLPALVDGGTTYTAGAGFVYTPHSESPSWGNLVEELRALSHYAMDLGQWPEAAQEVWITPDYLGLPAPSSSFPRFTMRKLLVELLAADLLFLSDRLEFVYGNAPRKDEYGQPFAQHVCYGLNACKGQDITGMATAAGNGKCATADPHVCSGQNHCKGQGGCGFSPKQPEMQNHPGQNEEAGQIKGTNGYWQANPNSDSACGSPIMPSIVNTLGDNTPDGGDPTVYDRANGYVWDFARLLFEEKNPDAEASDYLERYRTPFQTNDEVQ